MAQNVSLKKKQAMEETLYVDTMDNAPASCKNKKWKGAFQ
jgi:hypothetical protein